MTIGKALLTFWKESKSKNSHITDLYSFLHFNYKERHVELCYRVNVEPASFSRWLLKDIGSLL